MSVDTINDKGYQLTHKRSSRYPAKYLTDTDFADDIALISQSLENALAPLQSLEQDSNCVGLYLNESKTEYINKCTNINDHTIKTLNNATLKQVDDYKYLGSFKQKTFKLGRAWPGLPAMTCIRSGLPNLARNLR